MAVCVPACESGEGWSVSDPGMLLGPIGRAPRLGPKKWREFEPNAPKTRLSELFESNDWICADRFVKQGQLWIILSLQLTLLRADSRKLTAWSYPGQVSYGIPLKF